MDEAFFLWYEDIDLGARVSRRGGTVGIAQDLVVRHAGGASWGRISRSSRQSLRARGSIHYARKHLGSVSALALALASPAALAIGVILDLGHFVPGRIDRRWNARAAEGARRTSDSAEADE